MLPDVEQTHRPRCACLPSQAVMVQRRDALQRLIYVYQCRACGQAGAAVSHAWIQQNYGNDAGGLPSFDETAQQRHAAARRAAAEDRRARYRAEYLNSPHWKAKRVRILERDGWTCQACLTEQATDVHHKSYDRLGDEPAFDLVAICRACHERLHGR